MKLSEDLVRAAGSLSQVQVEERILRNESIIHSTIEDAWQAIATVDGVKAWLVHGGSSLGSCLQFL